jgi:hypothetical protein
MAVKAWSAAGLDTGEKAIACEVVQNIPPRQIPICQRSDRCDIFKVRKKK